MSGRIKQNVIRTELSPSPDLMRALLIPKANLSKRMKEFILFIIPTTPASIILDKKVNPLRDVFLQGGRRLLLPVREMS